MTPVSRILFNSKNESRLCRVLEVANGSRERVRTGQSQQSAVFAGSAPAPGAVGGARVRQGGHNVPRTDVIRHFTRGWMNFQQFYRPLADVWAVYDNSGDSPRLIEQGP
jgi:hypothetical protein